MAYVTNWFMSTRELGMEVYVLVLDSFCEVHDRELCQGKKFDTLKIFLFIDTTVSTWHVCKKYER